MSTEALTIGPATELDADVVYALPAQLIFITSTVPLESSLDGSIWASVADADTTGAVLNAVFVRAPGADAIVVCRAANVIAGGGSSNPFDQDLNTTDIVQFAGITFAEAVNTITWGESDVSLSTSDFGLVITGGGLRLPNADSLTWISGPTIAADGFSLVLNSGLTIDGDGNAEVAGFVSASGYLVGATPGIDTTITTGSLVGKTITITKGIITGFA